VSKVTSGGASLAIVDEVICRDYDVDREQATRDVREVVTELIGHGVLTEVS